MAGNCYCFRAYYLVLPASRQHNLVKLIRRQREVARKCCHGSPALACVCAPHRLSTESSLLWQRAHCRICCCLGSSLLCGHAFFPEACKFVCPTLARFLRADKGALLLAALLAAAVVSLRFGIFRGYESLIGDDHFPFVKANVNRCHRNSFPLRTTAPLCLQLL